MTNDTNTYVAYDPNTTPCADNIAAPLSAAFPGRHITIHTNQARRIDPPNAYEANTIKVEMVPRDIASITDNHAIRMGNFLHTNAEYRTTSLHMCHIPVGGMNAFPYIGIPSAKQQNNRHPYYMAYMGFHSNGGINIYINIQDSNQWEQITTDMVNAWAKNITEMITPKRLSDNIEQVHATFVRACEKIEQGKQQEANTRVHQQELAVIHAGSYTKSHHIGHLINEELTAIAEKNITEVKQRMRDNFQHIMQMPNVHNIKNIIVSGQPHLIIQLIDIQPKGNNNPENIVYNDIYAIINLHNNSITLIQPENTSTPYRGREQNPNIRNIMHQYNRVNQRSNAWNSIPNIDLTIATQELMLQYEYARALTRHIRYLTRENPYNPYFQSTT